MLYWNKKGRKQLSSWLQWGKEKQRGSGEESTEQLSLKCSYLNLTLAAIYQVNTQGILDSKDMTIHHAGMVQLWREKKADKNEEEKERGS